jgi:tetratricopeptide (TPR) repeat protein
MKRITISFMFLLAISQNSFSQTAPDEIYKKCSDAVLMVLVFGSEGTLLSYGSGVVVSENGLVYTNYHVVKNAKHIQLRNSDIIYDSVKIAGFDPFADAAVLKLPDGSYPYIEISNQRNFSIGSTIYTLGNPRGYKKTISHGLISALRTDEYPPLIQISAPISSGSSGGAMLDDKGSLIGITSLTNTMAQNVNFAIPIYIFGNIGTADINDTYENELTEKMLKTYEGSLRADFYTRVNIISEYSSRYKEETVRDEHIGRFYHNLNEEDSAIACLTRVIDQTGGDHHLYRLRAECFERKNDTAKVLGDYDKSISICSKDIDTYISRATYFQFGLKDYRKAIDDYHKILDLNPEYDFVYTSIADCMISLNDQKGAIIELSKSLNWKVDNPDHYNKRAEIYSNMKLYDEAISDYSNSLFYSPMQAELYLYRAVIYSKMNEHRSAIRDYLEYLKYSPDEAAAYNNLAYSYMSLEQFTQAEENFNNSLYYDPYHMDSFLGLAILNFRRGKINASVKFMCGAIETNEVLLHGMTGIKELESSGWFWDKKEKRDIKKIFKIMGITDSEIERVDTREKYRQVKKVKAQNSSN